MTLKGWFSNNNNNDNNNNSTSAFKKNNKKHQPQQHPTITTITAPLPPFSTSPPPYSHTLSLSLPSTSSFSASSCNTSSSYSPLASTAPSAILSPFQINKRSPLRHTIMQQPQQHHAYSSTSSNNGDSTSPKPPRPYTLNVLPTTSSSSNFSSCSASRASPSPSLSPATINNDLFIAMTMNPRKSVPRPPTEFCIRPSTPPSISYNKNSTATYSNGSNLSNLDKALPAPPKRATKTKTTAAALLKFKGFKTRLRTHSFSSSTFSFPTPSTSSPQQFSVPFLVPSSHKNPSSSTVSTTPESVAQEYARTIKSLWKMIEDEEQAYRLVEASHSLSGSIPTIADISPSTGGVVNRPPYVGSALRRPSLPLLMTVQPIQEEEETSTATSPTRSPFSPRPSSGPKRRHHAVSLAILNTTPLHTKPTTLACSPTNEMDHTIADLDLSPVAFSDASEEEYSSENDSEAEEERAVVHVAQKVSVYRGRSFCWSQPA
ncbi:MAG: hypothetical protein JOS17DRAFT_773340 [Linnemannia elongata]|nr:MAG: hypothetical protein JOS17DRAFT_773340 [Linnemannia elongata]